MLSFRAHSVSGLALYTLDLRYPNRKKSNGVRSGDLGGHNGFAIRFSAGNLLVRKFCGSRGMWGSIVMLKVGVAEYRPSSP